MSAVPGQHGTFCGCRSARFPRLRPWGLTFCICRRFTLLGRRFARARTTPRWRREGDHGSPWAIGATPTKDNEGGHKAIHPELGTFAEFDHLVAAAATHGLEIALDIAFQCSPDHPWVKEHPAWFITRPDGSIQYAENPPKKYQDIYPLNFESADWRSLWEELHSVFEFWIKRGVKIFRVDNPHTRLCRSGSGALDRCDRSTPIRSIWRRRLPGRT